MRRMRNVLADIPEQEHRARKTKEKGAIGLHTDYLAYRMAAQS